MPLYTAVNGLGIAGLVGKAVTHSTVLSGISRSFTVFHGFCGFVAQRLGSGPMQTQNRKNRKKNRVNRINGINRKRFIRPIS